VSLPTFLYGTAWKEARTEELARLALAAGFRGIDTANQRKHYVEAAVGAAIRASGLPRAELFLQTKFTYARGQDHRLPYDPAADIAAQVRQSFASSLTHLGVETIDSYLLHGPWSGHGWSAQDREAWSAMEQLHREGRAARIGVSNVSLEQLAALCAREAMAPAFVQNRCYARTGWDREVRAFCRERGIVYQGFSLLTANRRELESPAITAIARRHAATVPQIVFRFAIAAGLLPLTGTGDRAHMDQDLAAASLDLSAAELAAVERLGG
jgi:diketogulonate reductase-like aldo/keto reductase